MKRWHMYDLDAYLRERAACGLYLGDEVNVSSAWSNVDCRRCLAVGVRRARQNVRDRKAMS